MEEKKKVFIRGNKDRGDEIRGILAGLGATNYVSCDNDNYIYFINHENEISATLIDSEVGRIIMDNYKEIELPPMPWKDGDILAFSQRRSIYNISKRIDSYAVFKKYTGKKTFESYIFIHGEEMHFGMTFPTAEFHLANEKEKEDFSRMYNYMVSHLKAVNTVLK